MTNEERCNRFKLKAIKVHKGYYLYDKVDYVDNRTKVNIVCPLHGDFWQTPSAHVNGQRCPKCANITRGDTLRSTSERFKERALKVHKGRYCYDEVVYVNAMSPVKIICKVHGVFEQIPMAHLIGNGCPKCAGRRRTNDEIISMFTELHGDKYDYSRVEFSKMHNKVCMVCHKKDKHGVEHGEFWQTPAKHLTGQGCPKCGNERRNDHKKIDVDNFIKRANKVHKSFYDYSEITCLNSLHDKVNIRCPKHGVFTQLAYDHLAGHGCVKCAVDESRVTTEEFIERSTKIHNGKYDYSMTVCNGTTDEVEIGCPSHGVFTQVAGTHLKGRGCPKCGKIISVNENELYDFVCNLVGSENVERNDRSVLDGREIDIYIPSMKIGIEYNGVIWHSEKFGKGREYHLDKLNGCRDKGVKLIQVFEDEYVNHKNIVFGKIRHILGYDRYQGKVYGRKCVVREVDRYVAKVFLDRNHIQGYVKSTLHLGAFNDGVLVAVMSFLREKGDEWNLTRFATDITKKCSGLGGKVFSHFVREYDPSYVKSFADRRWTMDEGNNLYVKLGFRLDEVLKPDYRYVKNGSVERVHKFNFRKRTLNKKYGLPLTMTEKEMCDELGFNRIWDCGLIKYVYEKPHFSARLQYLHTSLVHL